MTQELSMGEMINALKDAKENAKLWAEQCHRMREQELGMKDKEDPCPPDPISYLSHGWRAQKGPQDSNKSGFRAVGHRVLLSPDEVEKKSAGGLVLIEKTIVAEENKAVICTVLEIGHDCWSDKSTDYCQVGDRVLVGLYTGKFHISPIDGKKYRFVMDTDVISPLPPETKDAK